MNSFFVFDLDGTITKQETLPLIAAELGISDEVTDLTKRTLSGEISFAESFNRRVNLLKGVSLDTVHRIMKDVPLDECLLDFIQTNRQSAAVITGNLDLWIEPIVRKLGCRVYSSTGGIDEHNHVYAARIIDKGAVVRSLKTKNRQIIATGDGAGDIAMFLASDVGIAYGGVHEPPSALLRVARYFAKDSAELIRLLNECSTNES